MSFPVLRRDTRELILGVPESFTVENRDGLKLIVLPILETGWRGFRLDFTRNEEIDSAALSALISVTKKVREAGGSITLFNLNKMTRDYLVNTHLDEILEVEPN